MRLRRVCLVAAAVLLVLMTTAGCRASDAPVTYMDEGFQDLGAPQSKPLPGLELVDPSSFDATDSATPGALLESGSYTVVLSGDTIKSAQWQKDLSTGLNVLSLRFDPAGAKVLSEWTSSHIGEQLPVVLNGKVVVTPQVLEPIADGTLMISTDDLAALQWLESAVPLQR